MYSRFYTPCSPRKGGHLHHLLQINQTNREAVITATRVNGNPILINCLNLRTCPSFFKIPDATILAEAPIGVILPPTLAPINKPNRKREGLIANRFDMESATGSIAARKGTLSTKAEKRTAEETSII